MKTTCSPVHWALIPVLLFAAVLPSLSTAAPGVAGTYTVQLTKPVDEATITYVSTGALAHLRRDLFSWLEQMHGVDWDTTRVVDSLNLDRVIEICRRESHKKSWFDGSQWSMSYTIDHDALTRIVNEYNTRTDTLTLRAYRRFQQSRSEGTFRSIYLDGIATLRYSTGRIGPPLNAPEKLGVDISHDVARTLDTLFAQATLTSENMVLEGRPGGAPLRPVTISLSYRDSAVEGVLIGGHLADGRVVVLRETDSRGAIPLDTMRLPFVAGGTFLTLRLMPGAQIEPGRQYGLEDFNITFRHPPGHMLMFNLSRPTYTLSYQASAVSDISIPTDFAAGRFIQSFLRDSCHLQPGSTSSAADLAFTVRSQISQYHYDEREETVVTVEMLVGVEDRSVIPPLALERTHRFQLPYKLGVDVPLGLFFWETTRELQRFIRSVLNEL